MRYVLVVGAVLAMVGCGGESAVPECEAAAALCPEGLTAICVGAGAGGLATMVAPASGDCVGVGGIGGGPTFAPSCALTSEAEAECPGTGEFVPACVEAPSTDPNDCARWLAECDALGEPQCYVLPGTDEVIPL